MAGIVPSCSGCGERDAIIAALREEVAALTAQVATLRSGEAALSAQVASHVARVEALEERLRANSSNSSKPPSTDSPFRDEPRQSKEPSGRKPGGQPGHPGKARTLLPPERVTETRRVTPTRCGSCGGALHARDVRQEIAPERHQVLDLPEAPLVVTEYQMFRSRCPCCGEETRAALPAGVPPTMWGPRLAAFVSYLSARCQNGARVSREMLQDVFDVRVSLGAVAACNARTGAALEAAYEEALAAVRNAAAVNADETGWRQRARRFYLWTAVAAWRGLAVFKIEKRRDGATWERFVGRWLRGALTTDRHGAYNSHEETEHQYCWAHLKRDFEKVIERGGESKKIGDALLGVANGVFAAWGEFQRAGDRAAFGEATDPLLDQMLETLERGVSCSYKKTAAFCRRLLRHDGNRLWAFAWLDGVEPTNNVAERALRPAVMWRKRSQGTWSEAGSRTVERLLTVMQSLRMQGRSVYAFLAETLTAALAGRPPPRLAPA